VLQKEFVVVWETRNCEDHRVRDLEFVLETAEEGDDPRNLCLM
jgi:hypothetical protein